MNVHEPGSVDLPVGPTELGGITHQRLLSSTTRAWPDLSLASYRVLPQPELVDTPGAFLPLYTIIVHMSATPTELRCRIHGPTEQWVSYPGSLCLLPAHTPTAFSWSTRGENLHIQLAPTLIAATTAEIAKTDPTSVEMAPHLNLYDPLVQQICLALLTELKSGQIAGDLYTETLGRALALLLLRNYSSNLTTHVPPKHGLSAVQLRCVLEYINDQLDQSFTPTELSALAGLSPTYFAHQFRQATGLAPHQYVLRRRVDRAKALLLRGKLTVAEVASRVGFADQSHLCRHFKHLLGVTPITVLRYRDGRPDGHEED